MKLVRLLMPRIEYILCAAIFWFIAAIGPIILNLDGDLPRHILTGQLIRANHAVELVDIFSYRTTGIATVPYEWLSQIIFSLVYDSMGLGGVVLATAFVFTLAWALIFQDALRRSQSLFISLGMTGLGAMACLIHVIPRPHIFSYLLIAIWILLLENMQTKPTYWKFLPLVILIWANTHGLFVFGVFIWGIYLAGLLFETPVRSWITDTRIRSMLAGGIASIAATVISPSGFKIWETFFLLGGNDYLSSRVIEYQSANFHHPETWPFIIILLLLMAMFGRTSDKTPWKYVFLMTSFAGLAIYYSRMLPVFAILAVPIVTQLLSNWLKGDFPNNPIHRVETRITPINNSSGGAIWLVGVVLIVTALFRSGVPIDLKNRGNIFDPAFFPVDAVTWLESHPQPGHMLNEYDWGGYILFRLWPEYQIFMDGHVHIYGEKFTREYEQVAKVEDGWQAVLEKYQVQWAIVRAASPLETALETEQWQVMFKDDTTVILRRPNR